MKTGIVGKSRYIDADKLLVELQEEIDFKTSMYTEEQNQYFSAGLKCAYRDVIAQPTADVVEVVRCKDCMHHRAGTWCAVHDTAFTVNDYCSYAERSDKE